MENVSTSILKILFIYHVRFAAPSKHLIQLRFPKHIRTIPFNLLAIVPGEMLNTFAAKWTSWAIEIKWVMRVFSHTKRAEGKTRGGKWPQQTIFRVGGAVETINKCEIDPDRGRGSGSRSKMELLNFWFLVNWADNLPVSFSAPWPRLFHSFCFPFAIQLTCRLFITQANAEGRHENPHHHHYHHHHHHHRRLWWTLYTRLFHSHSICLFPTSIVLFYRTLAAVLHCFWSFVWRHSHLPLLLSSAYSKQKSICRLYCSAYTRLFHSFGLFVQPLSWWFPYA